MPLFGAFSITARDHLVEVVSKDGRGPRMPQVLLSSNCRLFTSAAACGSIVVNNNYAPVSPIGIVPVEGDGPAQGSSVVSHSGSCSSSPCPPTARAADAVIATTTLSSFKVVSNFTSRGASFPNCSNVTMNFGTNSPANNDDFF